MSRRRDVKSRLAISLATALIALASLAGSAAAAAAAPALPGAGSGMSLVFSGETAHVVGRTALLPVRCLGSRDGVCSGTVSVAFDGNSHRAPFSVPGGSTQDLTVPVGPAGQLHGRRAIAVARTAQAPSPLARSTAVIHFR